MKRRGAPNADHAARHVAQPPSAVPPPVKAKGDPRGEVPDAKPGALKYHRNLPRIVSGRPLYVTFCTLNRWVLPESVRGTVIKHCLHDHGAKCWVHCLIIMPDHVHMILSLYRDSLGCRYGLAEIMNGIKGASAHSVNKALMRTGAVWQDESFDHVLRSDECVGRKAEYIQNNPVRKGLVKRADDWPWFWADWMDVPR